MKDNNVLKLITPPTVEEVCKALSEYTGCEVKYDVNETVKARAFFYGKVKYDLDGIKYTQKRTICVSYDDEVMFNTALPTYLITLIGRFYEGVAK
jgi:benzoyl-CoA reductase/2-hydroxyglutaryl-CoA dehydratase subunit BcrC/BadD/HgdB